MSEAPKRKGIRLPWLGDEDEAASDAAAQSQNGQQPATPAEAEEAAPASAAPVTEAPPSEAAGPLMQSMVEAMRRIADQARDDAIALLAAAVEQRTAEMQSNTELRAAELRDRAEADVARIGEWEQGEVQRIREEATTKVGDRQRQLDGQLQANIAAGEAAMSAVASRIEVFERQMAGFFAKLSEIHDPVAFASAVKQMPSPPVLPEAAARPRPTPVTAAAKSAPSWPAEPEMPAAAAEQPEPAMADVAEAVTPEPEPVEAEAADAPVAPVAPVVSDSAPVEAKAEEAGGEMSTQILVTGLGSFGAITSFKQSLERAEGIRRVTLGLGTSGEFVFTATHAPSFDPTTAIRSFENAAQFSTEKGQLKVSVGANA
jgi:hypothetical protein